MPLPAVLRHRRRDICPPGPGRRPLRAALWLAAAALASLSFWLAKGDALASRAPHCVAEQTRALLIALRTVEMPAPAANREAPPRARLEAEVLADQAPHCADLSGRRLRLSWYFPPPMRAGETWQVAAEVRPPWGLQNPGGFDYERWLLANGFDALGYIRRGERLQGFSPGLRQRLLDAIAERLAAHRNRAYLLALATGSDRWMSDADWTLLRRTGTVHLLVISGLHVGLAAAFGFALGMGMARLAPWLLPWAPAGWIAAGISLGMAWAFVWLSGAGVPAMRAGLMSSLAVCALLSGRAVPVAGWLASAALILICLQPLSVLTQGFWLSFGAVALLISGFAGRLPRYPWPLALLRAQALMTLGMWPLLAMTVGEAAPAAGPANLFAVPWVSFIVVPLTLAALLSSVASESLAQLCWAGADAALSALLGFLNWLDGIGAHSLPLPMWQGMACLAGLGCVLWAAHGRALLACLPLCLAALLTLEQRPLWGEARVLSLDVGQGSAILVDTRSHRLLFDAGARTASGFDLGEAAVLPAIAATGPRRLDRLIVSHGDLDHAGGAQAVLLGLPVQALLGEAPGLDGQPCRQGQAWVWDGVAFEILHPPANFRGSSNNASCVLRLRARSGSALLTGDIETGAERRLLAEGLGPVDLLFAPHHGSNTSSSPAFLDALRPRLAIATAGYDNRYGHPHPAVAARYRERGIPLWITGLDGALAWRSEAPDRLHALRRERRSPWTWWVNQPP